jgi:hypothetical protein
MHRRIHVADVPFVGGNLAVRMQIGVAQHQVELLLPEVQVHQRLSHDIGGVGIERWRNDGRIKFIGLPPSSVEHFVEVFAEGAGAVPYPWSSVAGAT